MRISDLCFTFPASLTLCGLLACGGGTTTTASGTDSSSSGSSSSSSTSTDGTASTSSTTVDPTGTGSDSDSASTTSTSDSSTSTGPTTTAPVTSDPSTGDTTTTTTDSTTTDSTTTDSSTSSTTDSSTTGTSTTGEIKSCVEWEPLFAAEVTEIRGCMADGECGQELKGTSCGCTRNWVARLDADTTEFWALVDTANELGCELPFFSTCDCPATDGFACSAGICTWNYI